jgi:DNA-binding IclR family transcriptional regulator
MSADAAGPRAVERAADILIALAEGPDAMGVTQLARELGLSKGTVHRLLRSLLAKGLVAYVPGTQAYRLGGRALQLGLRVQDRLPLRKEAEPTLRELRDVTGETAALFMVVGDRIVAVEQAVTRQEPRRLLRIGSTIPLHSGATGRVLLAFLGSTVRDPYLARAAADPALYPPLGDAQAFRACLDAVRARGYEINEEEEVPVNALAFPILNGDGALLGGITIIGPPRRWTRELMELRVPECLRVLEPLAQRVKYITPDTPTE